MENLAWSREGMGRERRDRTGYSDAIYGDNRNPMTSPSTHWDEAGRQQREQRGSKLSLALGGIKVSNSIVTGRYYVAHKFIPSARYTMTGSLVVQTTREQRVDDELFVVLRAIVDNCENISLGTIIQSCSKICTQVLFVLLIV